MTIGILVNQISLRHLQAHATQAGRKRGYSRTTFSSLSSYGVRRDYTRVLSFSVKGEHRKFILSICLSLDICSTRVALPPEKIWNGESETRSRERIGGSRNPLGPRRRRLNFLGIARLASSSGASQFPETLLAPPHDGAKRIRRSMESVVCTLLPLELQVSLTEMP